MGCPRRQKHAQGLPDVLFKFSQGQMFSSEDFEHETVFQINVQVLLMVVAFLLKNYTAVFEALCDSILATYV